MAERKRIAINAVVFRQLGRIACEKGRREGRGLVLDLIVSR